MYRGDPLKVTDVNLISNISSTTLIGTYGTYKRRKNSGLERVRDNEIIYSISLHSLLIAYADF